MTPALAICIGLLHLADADSGTVEGCTSFRLPDVDAPETSMRHAECAEEAADGRDYRDEARRQMEGRLAAVDMSAPADSTGQRRETSPLVAGVGDLRAYVIAQGWAVPFRYGVDPEPDHCEAQP